MARRSSSTSPTHARAAVKLPHAVVDLPLWKVDTLHCYCVYFRKQLTAPRVDQDLNTRSICKTLQGGPAHMYLAAAHDPNDTRHATLRPPSHHHMHAQDGKPGCFRSPYRHRILLGTSTSWQPPNPSSTPTEQPHSCTAYFVYASTRNQCPRLSLSAQSRSGGSRYTLSCSARLCPRLGVCL